MFLLDKPLPDIFNVKDFMAIYDINQYQAAEILSDCVIDKLIKQIVRVQLPSGMTSDFNTILDIPIKILDVNTNKMHVVLIENISILYRKLT